MPESLTKEKKISYLLWFLCLAVFVSLVGNYRAVSSISIGLLLLTSLINNWQNLRFIFKQSPNTLFLSGLLLLFIVDFVSLFYSADKQAAWDSLRTKTGLVLIPLSVYPGSLNNQINRRKLLIAYCITLLVASLYCIGYAVAAFRISGDQNVFFYHRLVSPLHQHAVYFSILVFVSLVFLIETAFLKAFAMRRPMHWLLIIYFSGFLCLLSSKLVIIVYGFYLVFVIPAFMKRHILSQTTIITCSISLLLALTLLIAVKNPISQRFSEIAKGDLHLIHQDRFDKRDYFNGLQFRLLQWRFVADILSKNHAWPNGVGLGDGQALLDREYIDRNMYTGDPATGSKGYLIYNTHNQFLESLLQTGIPGLLAMLVICFAVIRMAITQRQRGYSFILALLLAWLFTESVFETQYGILIFTFFPLILRKFEPKATDHTK